MILRAPILAAHAAAILATHIAAGALLGALGTAVLVLGARRGGTGSVPEAHHPTAMDGRASPNDL